MRQEQEARQRAEREAEDQRRARELKRLETQLLEQQQRQQLEFEQQLREQQQRQQLEFERQLREEQQERQRLARELETHRNQAQRAERAREPQRPQARVDADAAPDSAIPDAFLCPITCVVMTDPVQVVGGDTFEREAIARWLASHDTSPMTNEQLASKALTPNRALRDAIEQWLQQRTAVAQKTHFLIPQCDVQVFLDRPIGRGQNKAAFRGRWANQDVAVLQVWSFSH